MAIKPLSPVHLNGNLLVAVAIQTTGKIPGFNDIFQLAVVPLKPDYTPSNVYPSVDLKIKPSRPALIDHDETKMKRAEFVELLNTGLDPSMAAELFESWFTSLDLPSGKNLIPVGHDFCGRDKAFLIDWLQLATFNFIFSPDARDVLQAALFVNDLADWRADPVPFARYKLGALCRRLGVERQFGQKDAILNALAAAECYKRILAHPR